MKRLKIERRGLMFVLSSPSGAGKSTLASRILAQDPDIHLSVSVTTREPRPGEVHGKDYFFETVEDFERKASQGEFLEHAQVFGNYYATPKAPVMEALNQGRDVLFDVDWQGARQLEESAQSDLVRVFILPPSTNELAVRLKKRAQDTVDIVKRRMTEAAAEISHWAEYEYVIVNEDIERSHSQLMAILTAERLRRTRQVGLNKFVYELQEQKTDLSALGPA